MAIKYITLAFMIVAFARNANTQEDACVVDVDRDLARSIVEHSKFVKLGEIKLPIPRELESLEFQVSEHRGQFVFRKNISPAESSNPEKSSADEAGISGLHSIVFTTGVEVSSESEIFFVAEKCSLGEILVSYIRMKGIGDQPDAKQTLMLKFPGSASVLLFGHDYDLYLGMLQQINH